MRNKCDVLVLIWGMEGRDPEALIPVIYLLREKYNLTVIIKSMFEFSAIDWYKPKILYMNGCIGSGISYMISKYAKQRGVYVVTNHAEGIFNKEEISEYLWGWNKEKIPTTDKYFLWNNNAYNWSVEKFPYMKDVLSVSGSIGHEKYRYLKDDNTSIDFLKKGFEGVILYIGWGFDRAIEEYKAGKHKYDPCISRDYTINYLKRIAEEFPRKLLILKYHPGVVREHESEIHSYFDGYDNVKILRNEYSMFSLIMLSDIITVFDSSAILDAWMCNKEVVTFCKDESLISYGKKIRDLSTICDNEDNLIDILKKFYLDGSKETSKEIVEKRKEILESCFGSFSNSPSKQVSEHIYHNLNHGKKKERLLSLKMNIIGYFNMVYYHLHILKRPSIFNQMRLHYKPVEFERQYNYFTDKLKKYYEEI